ncbi:putative MDH1-malate dehydrogenase precursor, mitochondrial [Tilletiaria anomala UBC 951]|uniref:Malate dehydrogenase n=1 Tax=Tilletiaria anomala (strain ATCC 24038 / CBS 436.72 / UBC 951) TaxID=1037660 RepID=A0A066VLL6_TILAU|nr:putative MDH1-malate dehydrogenase precursor, mitochondrial [Tilletiaria anomala UBC 951]KDN39465.1 putative MDH1-malate dehydrogenase precursor, mitochondrial [Tilletiaria anomala UBC 951]
MFTNALRSAARPASRTLALARGFRSSAAANKNVAIAGCSGGIGQPLSLLLKNDPLVTSLRLYDLRMAPGVAADVSHVNTPAVVTGYAPDNNGLEQAFQGADVIVVPAGVPRKPGMTRDDLFNTNASIVRDLAKAAAKVAPKAHILIISNPVNSTVPIVAEVFKKAGVYDPKKLYGVTTLDVTRASTFLSGIAGSKPSETIVPVVGGHSGVTIVPLLSQAGSANASVQPGEQYEKLVHRIQFGGDEVVKAKDGAGSATLSMAYAAAVFTNSLLRALGGEQGVKECAYVDSPLYKDQGVDFFATPVTLGTEGVTEVHPVGQISKEEEALLQACLPELKKNIHKGECQAM